MADLPKEPLTRQEMYLSKLAGENTTLPIEPLTREEMYLEGAIGRVEAVEEEVEELKNNPDVADIVATYADLQAYDTSKLTDKDVLRVLADETHDGDSTYYRYSKSTGEFTYIGESKQYVNFVGTDGQTAGQNGLVPAPATTDANKYLKSDGTWAAVAAGGGGEAKKLADKDYNWNSVAKNATTTPFDSIAPWLLPPGIYKAGTDVYTVNEQLSNKLTTGWVNGRAFVVTREERAGALHNEYTCLLMYDPETDPTSFLVMPYSAQGTLQTGSLTNGDILKRADIANNLTTTTWYKPLSAAQGKTLNDKINAISSYSTNEVNTGATWIDGKTIYKKSYSVTITGNSQAVTLGLSDLYEVVKIEAIWHPGGALTSGMPTTFCAPGDSSGSNTISFSVASGNSGYISSQGRNGTKGVITIYYTKSA